MSNESIESFGALDFVSKNAHLSLPSLVEKFLESVEMERQAKIKEYELSKKESILKAFMQKIKKEVINICFCYFRYIYTKASDFSDGYDNKLSEATILAVLCGTDLTKHEEIVKSVGFVVEWFNKNEMFKKHMPSLPVIPELKDEIELKRTMLFSRLEQPENEEKSATRKRKFSEIIQDKESVQEKRKKFTQFFKENPEISFEQTQSFLALITSTIEYVFFEKTQNANDSKIVSAHVSSAVVRHYPSLGATSSSSSSRPTKQPKIDGEVRQCVAPSSGGFLFSPLEPLLYEGDGKEIRGNINSYFWGSNGGVSHHFSQSPSSRESTSSPQSSKKENILDDFKLTKDGLKIYTEGGEARMLLALREFDVTASSCPYNMERQNYYSAVIKDHQKIIKYFDARGMETKLIYKQAGLDLDEIKNRNSDGPAAKRQKTGSH